MQARSVWFGDEEADARQISQGLWGSSGLTAKLSLAWRRASEAHSIKARGLPAAACMDFRSLAKHQLWRPLTSICPTTSISDDAFRQHEAALHGLRTRHENARPRGARAQRRELQTSWNLPADMHSNKALLSMSNTSSFDGDVVAPTVLRNGRPQRSLGPCAARPATRPAARPTASLEGGMDFEAQFSSRAAATAEPVGRAPIAPIQHCANPRWLVKQHCTLPLHRATSS
jgi:hypothetical protein